MGKASKYLANVVSALDLAIRSDDDDLKYDQPLATVTPRSQTFFGPKVALGSIEPMATPVAKDPSHDTVRLI